MKINNKEYKFNLNVKTKYLDLVKDSPDFDTQKTFVKHILIPEPTDKEVGEMGILTIVQLILQFNNVLEKRILDIKKKLSH